MNKILGIFAAVYISIAGFFHVKPVVKTAKTVVKPSVVVSITTKPGQTVLSVPTKIVVQKHIIVPTSIPTINIIPTTNPTALPNLTPTTKTYPDGFSPVTRTVSLHLSATAKSDKCLPGAGGELSVSLTNYSVYNDPSYPPITDYEIKGQIRGLKPNTSYIVGLDNAGNPLGGPQQMTDSEGNINIDRSGGYTVNYKNILNVFVEDPIKKLSRWNLSIG